MGTITDVRAGKGIDDRRNRADYGSPNGRFLKGSVSIRREGAIFENEVLAIAEWLRAGDTAADKTQVTGIPAKVFAINLGVADGHILAIPESILGIEDGIMKFNIAGILKSVFALQM